MLHFHWDRHLCLKAIMWYCPKSKEYKLTDLFKFIGGFTLSLKFLWPEVMETSLFEQVKSLKVPAFFFLGRHDNQAPCSIAQLYIQGLQADTKEIVWFEESAHLCNIEEENKFAFEILKIGCEC